MIAKILEKETTQKQMGMYVKSWWFWVKTESWKLAYEVQVPVHRQHWMNYLKTKQVSCKHTYCVESVSC